MKSIIRQQPLYPFLLTLFFVFHGYTENYDFIPAREVLMLFCLYLGSLALLILLFLLLYKNLSKASFIGFLLMGFYFFFGYIYDILDSTAPDSFFSKHSVILLTQSLITLFFLIFFLFYKTSLRKLNYILNVFFICLLIVDGIWLVSKMVSKKDNAGNRFAGSFTVCDTCSKPDIYLIVADDYAGQKALEQTMGFNNEEFTSQLQKRGFHVPSGFSNYNYTPFSISSTLEMEYLKNIKGKNTDHSDLSLCYKLIRENHVFQFLHAYGYQLYNYSIFDIHDQPAMLTESILPEKTKFITAQTLFARIEKNILFNMASRFGTAAKKKRLMLSYKSNLRALDSVKTVASRKATAPKFVYAHLIMPHYPYYFDKSGKWRQLTEIREGDERNLSQYVEYLQYTNGILLGLIDNILSGSQKPPVILLLSDHGFREYPSNVNPKYYFMNFFSIYTPHQNYKLFYDGISNVNLFRALFNQQFQQKFNLLKDSTVFIRP